MKQEIKEAQMNAAVGVRGQNKVSELAKDLARQFSGGGSDNIESKKQTVRIMSHHLYGIEQF